MSHLKTKRQLLQFYIAKIVTPLGSRLSAKEIEKIKVITHREEVTNLLFEKGDGIIYIPKHILRKLLD